MNQNWLAKGFFFALLLAILYGTFLILSPFLKAIIWAAILAVVFYPAYAWLLGVFRGKATAAALTIIVLVTLILVLPGLQLISFLSEEAVAVVKSVAALANGQGIEIWQEKPWVQELLRWWAKLGMQLESFDFQVDWKNLLLQGAQLSSGALVAQATGIAQNIFLFLANFAIVILTLFFFLRDGADFCYRLRRLLPMDQERQERLFRNIVDSLSAVVHGSLVVAMIQGFLAGLAYWILGVPYAVLWAVATAFAALVPVGGTTIVSVPVAIYLFLEGQTVRGLLLLGWCLGVVVTIDNILKPILFGTRLRLPMLVLFFGILGGLSVFGALGLILGPVLLALLAALLDLYLEEYGRPTKG